MASSGKSTNYGTSTILIASASLQSKKRSLNANSNIPSIPGYNLVRQDRLGGGGGAIKIKLNQLDVNIFNVYVPPASSFHRLHRPDLSSILDHADDDSFVLGDFNAHHSAWDASLPTPAVANFPTTSPILLS